MTIFNTAYETQACQGFVLSQVREGLLKAAATQNISGIYTPIYEVLGSAPIELSVPAFAHPFELKAERDNPSTIAVDARPFGAWDARQNEFRVRNHPDIGLLRLRAQLNAVWLADGAALLRDVSPLALGQYAEFLSKNVTRRFALNPREAQDLTILAGWFYLSCHTNDTVLHDRDRQRFVQSIARATRVSAEEIFQLTDQVDGPIRSVAEFCRLMEPITQSVRLRDINVGVLYQMLTGSWFGTNAAEIVTVAIEHPPTWVALLATAIGERTFKKSGLTQQVERARPDAQKQFVHAVKAMIGSRFPA